jgi:hypothetical protein
MDIVVSSSRLRPILFTLMALVVSAGVAVEVAKDAGALSRRHTLLRLLSLSGEFNLPTLYTAAVVFSCALLLALVAAGTQKRGGRFVPHWWVLAAGFLYISIDEIMQLHEALHDVVDVDAKGVLFFRWVIPAAVIVLVVLLSYLRFLLALEPRTRNRFLLAGAIYVGGALGMELPLGWWADQNGIHNLVYGLIDAAEESMEMLGLNLFLLALLDHLAREEFSVRFAPRASEASS